MLPAVLFLAVLVSAPQPPSAKARREAASEATKALASWEANEFADAAEHFLAAFELSGESTQLRNAAKAFEAAGARDRARGAWTRFLALADISAEDRRHGEERVRALAPATITATVAAVERPAPVERAAPVEAPAAVERPAPVEEVPVEVLAEPPPEAPIRWKPWVLVGAGVAATAVGGVLWSVSANDLADLRARLAVKEDGKFIDIDYEVAVAEEQRIEGLRIGSAVAIGAGIAAVLAGLSWWWFEW